MKQNLRLILLLLIIVGGKAHAATDSIPPALSFKENKSQWDKQALFSTQLQSGAIFLSRDSFTFILADTADMNRVRRGHHPWMYQANLDLNVHLHIFRQVFENANANATVSGTDKLNEYFNFYLGNDHSKWASHVNAFYNVTYQNMYNNINLQVGSQGVNMKYFFVVNPGGNPADIKMDYVGTDGAQLVNGDLVLKTSIGDVTDTKPYAYQMEKGERQTVNCLYVMKGNTVWFEFPDGYDKNAELIIDPTLIFSTFSGSDADNFGYSATYDSKGNAYAAGTIFQYNGTYPTTTGAFQTSWAGGVGFGEPGYYDGTGTDVGITKYDSLGKTRIYSTYLGGDHDELPHSLMVNSNDELFVLGSTASDNFPVTSNAFQTTFHGGTDMGIFDGIGVHYATGSDIFITRFNPGGTALLASTYVGGSDNDGLTYPEYVGLNYNYADDVRGEIAIDKNDNVYVASTSRSKDFPVTPGAYQTVLADSSDAVVFKMDDNLTHMIWSTFLGGNDNDAAYSIDFDPNGDLYIGGGTLSTNFPTTQGVIQTTNHGGRADGFIAHLSQNGNTLLQSTYWGSNQYDQVYFVRTDKLGHAYAFGQTEATDSTFIHNAAYNKPKGGQFITKFSPALDSIIWSTTFGTGKGTPDISPTAFLVDVCNKTYVSGWGSNFFTFYGIVGAPPLTTGGLEVTPNAVQLTTDSNDFYIMVMEDDASALNYATYFGSPTDEDHVDGGTSRFDKRGIIYESACAGCNGQSSFPTTAGVVSNTNNSSNCNNAVFKINFNFPIVVAAFANPPTGCTPDSVTFQNQSQIATTATYQWTFGDGGTSTALNPSHVYTQSGIYTVQLVVNDPGSCNLTDTITHQITVIAQTGTDTIPTISICQGQQGQIGVAPGYDSAVTYTWIPASYLSQSNISNPFAQPPVPINYELLVSNGICIDTFRQKVLVDTNTLSVIGDSLLCSGDTATLSAINSQPGQYTYSWQPASQITSGANSSTPVVQPTQSASFTVVETNATGCSFSDSVHITVSAGPQTTVGFSNPPPACVPDTVSFNNQSQTTGNPSFQWSFGDGDTSTAFNPMHIYPQPGTYTVRLIATYPGTCKVIDTVTHQLVVLAIGSTDTLPTLTFCSGQSGQIGIASGIDSTVTYQWTPATYLNQTNIPNPVVSPLQSTNYQLVITAGACSDTFTQKVLVDSDALILQGGAVPCSGDTLTIRASNTQSGQQLSYVWQPSSQVVSGDSTANPLVKPSQTTTFIVTAVNPKGCTLTDSVVVSVTSGIPTVHAYATPDTIAYGDTAQLNLNLSPNVISINWQPDSSIIGLLNIANPQADPKATNTYFVEVADSGLCKKYDTVTVYVTQSPCAQTNIYIPNAFSPNGDGKNDVLYVRGNGITRLSFSVYDRWGEKVFYTQDQAVGWDGTYKGKKMDAAVFGYYAEGLCPSGEKFKKKGNVTLLR